MNQVVLLGDLHFGARNDSDFFLERQLEFFERLLFPFLMRNRIPVIQLGDLFDKRKTVNLNTLAVVRERVFSFFEQNETPFYTLTGNHDTYYKNTNRVAATELLTGGFRHIHPINDFSTLEFDGVDVDVYPWINAENYERFTAFLKRKSIGKIALGHFEFKGFDMYRGIPAHGGMSPGLFGDYEMVYSGHYHTRSTKGNVTYIGTPYELTWNDYGDQKGFVIVDLDTMEETWIDNPMSIHKKLIWPNVESPETYSGCVVKIAVEDGDSEFDDWILQLNEVAETVDVIRLQESVEVDVDPSDSEDTMSFMKKALAEHAEEDVRYNPKLLDAIMSSVHKRAIALK